MIPGLSFFERIPNKWIRCNAQYTLVGILIGLFVNIIFRITAGFSFSWPDTVMTFVVSIIITLCITNISLISGDIIRRKFTSPWQNVIINYLLIFLGVIIGTELSMLVFSALYDIPFAEIDQAENLRRNLSIGFLAGTVLYIYQLQSDNYNLKISEQELQLSKLKEMKTQSDLRTLQARINPHFLYNALNSITSLIHDEPGKAEEMTIKLSQLFRYSINNSESNLVRVREELHVVNLYLDIERVRFGDRIAFDVQAGAETLDALIPRFLLQPLVENALKHGLKQTGSGGVLRVAIARQDDRILISVHDNGIPFPKDMLAGYGMQSTFDKLNLVYGDAWKLEWINEPEKMIRLELPLNVPVLNHA